MSTESRSIELRGERRRARRFRTTLVAAVSVLAVLVGALTLGGALQGPRLRSGSINADVAIERTGQRLVLTTDQRVASVEADQVTVRPAAPVEVTADGTTVTVRFVEALRGGTDYRVTVDGVAGAATGVRSRLEYEFTTPDLTAYSLLRKPGDDAATKDPDEIRRHGVPGNDAEVVFSAARIQEYALLPGGLAVATLDEHDDSALLYLPSGETATQPISLPAPGTIRRLHGSGTSGLVGFTFTADTAPGESVPSGDFDTLYVADPSDGTGLAHPVLGLDGAPLAAMNWAWVPGTPSIVAQAIDTSLYLVDPGGATPPTPLGQHAELRGFIPGTTQLVVADPLAGSVIDLATGETTILDLPDDGLNETQYSQQLLMLGEDEYAEIVATVSPERFSTAYAVVAATASGHRVVFTPADEATIVRRLCVSPNGQYLAIEVTGAESSPDFYPNAPGYLGTTTYFVDLGTDESAGGLIGASVDWCG